MRRGLIVAACLVLSTVAFGQTADPNTIEQPFSEGGIVTLNLSSGDYTVRAGASDRLRVQWRADDSEHEKDLSKIQVVADVFERVATIRTKGPTSKARFTIDVPARSDVHLRVKAGEVRIEGIEGNKDIRMTAATSTSRSFPSHCVMCTPPSRLAISTRGAWASRRTASRTRSIGSAMAATRSTRASLQGTCFCIEDFAIVDP
jgi:hypothetical protein